MTNIDGRALAIPANQSVEAVLPAAVTHESLVAGHLLRLQSTDPTPVVLRGVQGTTPEIDASKARVARLDRSFDKTFGGAIGMGFLSVPPAMLGFEAIVAAGLTGAGVSLLAMLGVTFKVVRAENRTRALKAARHVTVPGPVAVAYRRVQSAAAEIEDGMHEREVTATARLAAEGVDDMVVRIAAHHTAATIHTPAAQALCAEVCRLAAEMDAYLTVHNAHRFAPGEDDALAAVSATSEFTFAPTATTPLALG